MLTIFAIYAITNFLRPSNEQNFCSCWPIAKPEQEFKQSELVIVGLIIQSKPYRAAGNLKSNKHGIKLDGRRYLPDSSDYIRHTVLVQRVFKSQPDLPDTIYIIARPVENCGPLIESFTIATALQSPNMLRYLFYVDAFQEYKTTTKIKGKKSINAIEKIKHQNIYLAEPCRRNKLALGKALEEIEQILPLVDTSTQKKTP